MASLGRKIVGGAIWTAGASWGSQLITLAVFVVLARYLGPDDFGVATLALMGLVMPTVSRVSTTRRELTVFSTRQCA
jgi:O-antigen/teichoic acid export membrane protein